jgi:iron complex outermembrane recepter protein
VANKDSRPGRDTTVPLRNPLIAAAVAAALGSTAGHAQEAGPALQEVVVTANRREENVLNIPYNISAISSKQIEAAGVTDV